MKTAAPSWFRPADIVVTLLTVSALFFLLTNAVPLIEWGIIPPLKSKMRYLLFNRILIPVTTLILLGIYFQGKETFQNLTVVRVISKIAQNHLYLATAILFFLYAGLSTWAGFSRHAALETRAFDLGIFSQAVWNTLQGDFLFSSIKENICLLGDHMSPILALLTPFYALWPDPRTLIILQAMSMAGCLYMITKIAAYKTNDRFIAFCFLIAYFFLSPPRGTLREDFHPEVLAEPILMLAFLCMERGRVALWVITSLIAASAKENIWGIVFMMSFYGASFKKHRLPGIIMMLFSACLFLFSVKIAIPTLSGKSYLYEGFYLNLFKNPSELGSIIASGETWEYILKIFSPVAFLSLLAPAQFILTLPILIQNILSNNPVFRSLSYHYTTGLIPFVMISAVYGLYNLSQKLKWNLLTTRLAACLMTALCLLLSGHSEYYFAWKSRHNITPHKIMIRKQLAQIPAADRVLTHNSLVPQFANRKYIYQFEHNTSPTKKESALARNADIVVLDELFLEPNTMPLPEVLTELQEIGYTVQLEDNGFYILRKQAS